jgi:ribonucleoside-diphosphate reductase alpha chain
MPAHQKALGLKVRQSNLCSEIMLHTGKDHLGVERTAVCCLSSVNAESFMEWRDEPLFIEDVMRFLDNVLEDFIQRALSTPSTPSTRPSASGRWVWA